ncbi:ABC transporter substrate-binding protein [Halorientalis regularis]|uniref:Amino acid/amide ABC transporter substrate-binding protein, HAAT family n=1 Tax=Halorientalis regularis TaxID=660518 RepID=A0A1G7FBZ3_9EURY|nr:ABC transporter substrate-binding protein [Halorientalis regularis]SDE73407.1 amino acid/amide ABC transporter substrate-binding protein, HAAT family [Halorientalis regularis]
MVNDGSSSGAGSANGSKEIGDEYNGNSSKLNRRRFIQAAGVGAAATGFAGCLGGGPGSSTEGIPSEVTIGVLAPAPENNPIGAAIANSAELAAKQINNSDKLLSEADNVKVSIKNTQESPSTGRQRYRALTLDEGAHMTTGVFTSEVLLQLMDPIAQQQTVHMTTGAASPKASKQVNENYDKYKYHFRTGPINGYHLGQNMVDFLEAKGSDLGWDSVALLVENYEWTNPVQKAIDDHIGDLDVDVAMERRYASGTQNFGPIYDSVEESGADAAFVAMAHTGTPAVVQWARDQRPFEFGGIHVLTQLPAYYSMTGGACQYTVTQNTATPQSELTDKTLDYAEAYNEANDGYPVYTGYITHDAIMQWANVATERGTVNSDEIVKGLEESSYTGTAGSIDYYGKDHKYAHDIKYNFTTDSPPETGVNPVFQQWQSEDGSGVQEVLHPSYVSSADYQAPPWV